MPFRNAGIVTISVGVGTATVPDQLLEIAGNESRLFLIGDYRNLNNITPGLVTIIEYEATIDLEGEQADFLCLVQKQLFIFRLLEPRLLL